MKIFSGFILIALGFITKLEAATWYTASTGGDISGNIWATTTNGTPGAISPALASGDILYIDNNIRCDGNFNNWSSLNITIYINATLTFGNGGQLQLGDNSRIIFQSASGRVIAEGGGSSNKINFGGGTAEWDGNDGPLTGPGSLDTNSNGVLPVELISFEAYSQSSNVVLIWSTATQLNFDYFQLQHSFDGMKWAVVTEIKGEGNTNELINYSYIHETAVSGKNYYRLKSIDFDETFEYSPVAAVDIEVKKELSVYPNPATKEDVVLYELNFIPQENDVIVVYDLFGSEITNLKISSLMESLKLPSNLESGTYVVKYISGQQTQTKRLVIR